jgi:hypothetical protein
MSQNTNEQKLHALLLRTVFLVNGFVLENENENVENENENVESVNENANDCCFVSIAESLNANASGNEENENVSANELEISRVWVHSRHRWFALLSLVREICPFCAMMETKQKRNTGERKEKKKKTTYEVMILQREERDERSDGYKRRRCAM